MTERLVSKLHVALLSYDEREIRVRKNYLEEQNPAICCVCFHSGEELLLELPLVAAEEIPRLTLGEIYVQVLKRAAMAKT